MGGGGASPTATRSPTRCPPKPCVPCPNATACRRCPTSPAHCGRKREGAMQFPTIGLFERTRTILKEPETRRLKNRGHLARNRKFESISLQQRVHELSVPERRSRICRLSNLATATVLLVSSAGARHVPAVTCGQRRIGNLTKIARRAESFYEHRAKSKSERRVRHKL